MKKSIDQNHKGFTLVEMLVSISLFSIVLMIALGTIITIIDTNRKSQSLTLVMNNMNFALESMTRTIKTATNINDGSDIEFKEQVDEGEVDSDWIMYRKVGDTIEKCIIGNVCVPIISSNVVVEEFTLSTPDPVVLDEQWRVFMYIKGKAQLSPKIYSDFEIQTTVSPRNLNI